MFCAWSSLNIIIAYTKSSSTAEENIGLVNTMSYHIHNSGTYGNRPHIPTPVLLWPPGRYHQWKILFHPHIVSSKDTAGSGPSTYSVHLNNIRKITAVLPHSTSTLSAKERDISPHGIHSLFIGVIQDKVSIYSAFIMVGVHYQHIKDLISKF